VNFRLIIAWLTFPGVMVHEWAHKVACERRGIPVHEVNYFNITGGGHVVHAEARRFNDTFAISLAPFLVGVVGCALFASAAGILYRDGAPFWIVAIGLWLALSIGMHAGPSPQDLKNVWQHIKRDWKRAPWIVLTTPLIVVMFVYHYSSVVWGDVLFGVGIVLAVWLNLELPVPVV
jgi:hypothetical protein